MDSETTDIPPSGETGETTAVSYPHDPFQPGEPAPQGMSSASGQPSSQPAYGQPQDGFAAYGQQGYGQAAPSQQYGSGQEYGNGQWESAAAGPAAPTVNFGQQPQQSFGTQQGYDHGQQQPFGTQQVAGAPYGQQPPGPWGGQPATGGPQQGQRKNKRLLLFGIAGGVLLVIIALVVTLIVVFTGDSGPGGSPKAAVQTYLDGLAAGDAKKALSVVRTPPSEKLLTDAVLKKQQASAKISDINVREPSSSFGSMATVKATYKFGDRNADVDFTLKKSDDTWTIDNGTIPIDVENARVPQLTAFGVDVSNESKVYVFPGPVEWGSANANFTVKADYSRDFPLGPTYSSYVNLDTELSDQGNKTVATAVDGYLTNCAASTQADASQDKPGCSQSLYQSVVPGSVRWTKPTDISQLRISQDYDKPTSVKLYGSVEWTATFTSTSSGPGKDTDTDFLSGTVDLSSAEPTFTPSR